MSETTSIEWTDATWNPVLGCSKVSEGCRGCYAIGQAHIRKSNPHPKVAEAFAGLTHIVNGKPEWTNQINLLPGRLEEPLRWKEGRRIFVNSLSDLFHPGVPFEFVDRVWATMILCPQHTFQVLTKRPERMAEYLNAPDLYARVLESADQTIRPLFPEKMQIGISNPATFPARNIWLGTSVEDQKNADQRIPHLLRCPAAARFLSCEPLLGPVDIGRYLCCGWCKDEEPLRDGSGTPYHLRDGVPMRCPDGSTGRGAAVSNLHWVITGGESGPSARPTHPDCFRSLRDQCAAAGVAYFHKQNGEWIGSCQLTAAMEYSPNAKKHQWPYRKPSGPPYFGMDFSLRVGKKAAGRLLDGRTHDEMPVGIAP